MFGKVFGGGNKNNNKNNNNNGLGGIWSWNNNGQWQDFDAAASKQVDDELRNQWQNTTNTIITFPVTKGPWFSQSRNRGIYFINVQLNSSRNKIKSVIQQNTKTGFTRQMKRTPPFLLHPNQNKHNNNKTGGKKKTSSHSHTMHTMNSGSSSAVSSYNAANQQIHNMVARMMSGGPMSGGMMGGGMMSGGGGGMHYGFGTMINGPVTKGDGSVCWNWQDDTQWREYDDTTQKQIEAAYSTNSNSVVLNQGPFFGAGHRQGLYQIVFNRNSMPPSFMQMNTQTHFQRKVERTGGQNIKGNNNNNDNSNSGYPVRFKQINTKL